MSISTNTTYEVSEKQIPNRSSRRKRIVVLAREAAVFQGLTQVMQRRLPEFEIVLAHKASGDVSDASGISLVLLHHRGDSSLVEAIRSCREHYGNVPTGIVMEDDDDCLADCELAFKDRAVQGLLPLELSLDVWMAALSLLISGGDYRPPFLGLKLQVEASALTLESQVQVPALDLEFARHDLTNREMQVLELVSEGFQNKLIANRMALSEHTVKVHVHNLITKLRVTNRTQAAAAFRDRLTRIMRPGDPQRDRDASRSRQ